MNRETMTPPLEAGAIHSAIERGLPDESLGRPVEVHTVLPSTNDRLKDLAEQGAPEGATVLALAQTRGRGQQGRRWISPAGKGLYLSVLFRPPPEMADGTLISVLAAVATADALLHWGAHDVALKPPNDVLMRGRKIAGILVEPRIGASDIEFAVVGIGLNLGHTQEDFAPLPKEKPATSCALEGILVDLAPAAICVLVSLTRRYAQVLSGRAPDLWASWTRLANASRC